MSRFLDERGRIFGKVNVVDILVLVVIVAVIVFAAVRMTGTRAETVPVTVVYTVEQVREPTVRAITNGLAARGTVTDGLGTVLGTLQDAVVVPMQVEYLTSQDELKPFASPIFRNIDITVVGQGRVSGDDTVSIGSVALRVGKKLTIVVGTVEVMTTITGVDH